MHHLANKNATFLAEYQLFYMELLALADFGKFNEEQFRLTGSTFRKLVREAVSIVVNHYYNLEEKCDEKWNFHRSELEHFPGMCCQTLLSSNQSAP